MHTHTHGSVGLNVFFLSLAKHHVSFHSPPTLFILPHLSFPRLFPFYSTPLSTPLSPLPLQTQPMNPATGSYKLDRHLKLAVRWMPKETLGKAPLLFSGVCVCVCLFVCVCVCVCVFVFVCVCVMLF